MAPVEYIVPLLPVDHAVLELVESALVDSFPSRNVVTSANSRRVFTLWNWAVRVASSLEDAFSEEVLEEDHSGDLISAYDDALHSLRYDGRPLAQSTFRVDALQDANRSFLDGLEKTSLQQIRCVASLSDARHWNFLGHLYAEGKLPLRRGSIVKTDEGFDILATMHMLLVQSNHDEGILQIHQSIFDGAAFRSLYKWHREESSPNDSCLNFSEGEMHWTPDQNLFLFPRKTENEHKKDEFQDEPNLDERWPDADNDMHHTIDELSALLKEALNETPLETPCSYLRAILWNDLELVPRQYVKAALVVDDPFDDIFSNDGIIGYVRWQPPHAASKWIFHLQTEDEVLQYCITNDWPLPGYTLNDIKQYVVFGLKPIEETSLIQELDQFWNYWNDCAITVRPSDNRMFVLETIPGMQFRSRIIRQDIQAAIQYFRNVIEAQHLGTLDHHDAEDLLGAKNTRAYFNKSLKVIPREQIFDISPEPIGRGANGAVYAARWQRPPGVLATTTHSASTIPVALKETLSAAHGVDALANTLRELDRTYSGLIGFNVCCIDFLGITTLANRSGVDGVHLDRRDGPKLVLVFEWAGEGSIYEHLHDVIPGMSFMKSWYRVIEVLSNIANGISTLHQHKLIHRDLHPNNVLVVRMSFQSTSESRAKVADFGEGKLLHDRDVDTPAGASYGCKEFRAPEVHGSQGWSYAADVFAYGVLCCKILELRHNICNAALPPTLQRLVHNCDASNLMPQQIATILQNFLHYAASDRLDIRSSVSLFQKLDDEFLYMEHGHLVPIGLEQSPDRFVKQVRWCIFDWREALRTARGDVEDSITRREYSTRDSFLDYGGSRRNSSDTFDF